MREMKMILLTLLVFVPLLCEGLQVQNLVLYDGVCKFCNRWVDVSLKLDRKAVLKYAALQSETGKAALKACGRAPEDISSIVYIPQANIDVSVAAATTRHFVKSDAVVQIAAKLGIPVLLFAGLLPLGLKDAAYDVIATNRYSLLGKLDSCRLLDVEYPERFLQ